MVRVLNAYCRFDAAFSTLTAEPGGGGLKLLPWDSFAAHVKLL